MASMRRVLLLILAASLLVACAAAAPQNVTTASLLENLSLEELGEQLQVPSFSLVPGGQAG